MNDVFVPTSEPGASSTTPERVRALCQKHWLGLNETPEHQAAAQQVRKGYFTTATEHYKAALRLYDSLTSTPRQATGATPVLTQINRSVQLLLAYSVLWEAFRHIYNAAAYTHFARFGTEGAPRESDRSKMDRVLREPFLPEAEVAKITLLHNGETPTGAIARLCSRHSRELEKISGELRDQTMTDMDAFMQGAVTATLEGQETSEHSWEAWVVRPLDDAGNPIDPDSRLDLAKYRSAIKWLCYQVHLNINFVDTSDDSLDDVILIMRCFCLLEPIVGILLQPGRKDSIFAL